MSGGGWKPQSEVEVVLLGTALVLLVLWTLLGNITVCAAVLRFRHLRNRVTNVFVVSLAASDLLVAALVMPWKAAAEVSGRWSFGGFCNTWVALDIMCCTASILNLCAISVDRYWAISSPFGYERSMSRGTALAMVGAAWAVSALISFLPVHLDWHRAELPGVGANASDGCDVSLSGAYAVSSSLISFYIPVAVMTVTYSRIYRIARAQISRISSLERAARASRDGAPRQKRRSSVRKEARLLKTLSVIMGAFACCWLPFFVVNCAVPFCGGPGCVSQATFDVFVWFGWCNSALNPVIYACNADFRDAFARLLGCRSCRGAAESSGFAERTSRRGDTGADVGVEACTGGGGGGRVEVQVIWTPDGDGVRASDPVNPPREDLHLEATTSRTPNTSSTS